MKPIQTIGIVINPQAGKGFAENARIAREALRKFPDVKIAAGPGELGASALSDYASGFHVCDCDPMSGRLQTVSLARNLADWGVDLILAIGGDGTLSDVALGLSGAENAPPVMGIGVGSTNVGPLVTCCTHELDAIDFTRLEITSLPALQVSHENSLLGIGFNDCVLGFTVVGTLAGQICDVDAAAKMAGQNLPGRPASIGTSRTLVERICDDRIDTIASGEWVSSVIIGLAERTFLGKAITGGVCLASYTGAPAGCLVASIPLVQVGLSRAEVLQHEPIRTSYISFDQTMQIRVQGVLDGTAINLDGTPLKILSCQDQIVCSVLPDAIRAVRLG
jgi:hypothetical protein